MEEEKTYTEERKELEEKELNQISGGVVPPIQSKTFTCKKCGKTFQGYNAKYCKSCMSEGKNENGTN